MIPNPKIAVACEGFAIDQVTNRATYFNVLDAILLEGVPALLQRFFVVTHYELGSEPAEFEERASLEAPDGSVIQESTTALSLVERPPAQIPHMHKSVHALWKNRFDSPGDHHVVIRARASESEPWEETARIRLPVVVGGYGFFPDKKETTDG